MWILRDVRFLHYLAQSFVICSGMVMAGWNLAPGIRPTIASQFVIWGQAARNVNNFAQRSDFGNV